MHRPLVVAVVVFQSKENIMAKPKTQRARAMRAVRTAQRRRKK